VLLWCILGGVLVLIIWAAYFIFSWGTALARRAAKKLENAIVQQASQQAMNARPERRAEIQALQKQVHAGISALKQSKLGRGRSARPRSTRCPGT
jgi:type VI secretion system protein ImpL